MSNENETTVAGPASMIDAAQLRTQAAKMMEEAASIDRAVAAEELRRREERRPKCPAVEVGEKVIVGFTKYQSGREYGYAAVGWRVGSAVRWTVTGQNTDRMNWTGLLTFIGEANWPSLYMFTAIEKLGPNADDEAPVAERMGSYGRVLGTSSMDHASGGVVGPLVHAQVPRTGYASASGGAVFGAGALSGFEHRFGADEDGFGGHY